MRLYECHSESNSPIKKKTYKRINWNFSCLEDESDVIDDGIPKIINKIYCEKNKSMSILSNHFQEIKESDETKEKADETNVKNDVNGKKEAGNQGEYQLMNELNLFDVNKKIQTPKRQLTFSPNEGNVSPEIKKAILKNKLSFNL